MSRAALADDKHQTPDGLATERPASASLRAGRFAWGLVALVVLIQFGLFRQFCLREVVWAYPPNHDQLSYLEQAYETYEDILDNGLLRGLQAGAGIHFGAKPMNAAGAMIHLEAAALFLVIGASRLSALTLNFAYYALFQCVLAGTLRWLSGRWSAAFAGLGLLLAATSPFYYAGGLFDFRLDCIAFSLFGVFICLVVRSRIFQDARWSAVAGLGGVLLISFRFFTLLYLLGALGLVLLWIAFRLFRSRNVPRTRQAPGEQLRGWVIAVALMAAFVTPLIHHHWKAIKSYYVVGHLTGKEKYIRAAEQGVNTLGDRFRFYPASLWADHLGWHYTWLAALLVLIAAAPAMIRRGDAHYRGPGAPLDVGGAIVFLAGCFFVPLGILTLNTSKSPVVGNVLVPPLTWSIIFLLLWMLRTWRDKPAIPLVSFALAAMGSISLAGGVYTQFCQYAQRTSMSQNRAGVEQLLDLYDIVATDSNTLGWKAPALANDCNSDSLNHKVIKILTYERHGYLLEVGQTLANSIFEKTADDVYASLARSDFVMLAQRNGPAPGFEYPFDKEMEAMHPQLMDFCRHSFVQIGRFPLGDRDLTLFIRPAVKVQAEEDGWVTSSGLSVVGLGTVLRARPMIEMIGENQAYYLPIPPHVTARLLPRDRPPVEVAASLAYEGPLYRMILQLDPSEVRDDGPVQIHVDFDEHFIPSRIGASADTRELILRAPTEVSLRAKQKQ